MLDSLSSKLLNITTFADTAEILKFTWKVPAKVCRMINMLFTMRDKAANSEMRQNHRFLKLNKVTYF